MSEAFNILLETTLDGRTILGAGAMQVTDGVSEVNGRSVETRRVSIDILIALVPGADGVIAPVRLIEASHA